MLKETEGRTRILSEDERKRYLEACKKKKNQSNTAYSINDCTNNLWTKNGSLGSEKSRSCTYQRGRGKVICYVPGKRKPDRYDLTLIGSDLEVFKKNSLRLYTLKDFPCSQNLHQSYDFRYPFEKALKMARIEDFS